MRRLARARLRDLRHRPTASTPRRSAHDSCAPPSTDSGQPTSGRPTPTAGPRSSIGSRADEGGQRRRPIDPQRRSGRRAMLANVIDGRPQLATSPTTPASCASPRRARHRQAEPAASPTPSGPSGDRPATSRFGPPVPCSATSDPAIGSTCAAPTHGRRPHPGVVARAGARSGSSPGPGLRRRADGDGDTTGDNTPVRDAGRLRPVAPGGRRAAYPLSAMFDALSDKLQAVLSDVRSRGKLNEDDVNKAMREIRLALLEADVNFKVVKEFTATLKERALGQEVLESLNPGQQVVKIVNEELTQLMGDASRQITLRPTPPTVILMAGPPGLGQDDRLRQARAAAEGRARQGRGARGLRRLPAGGRRPARRRSAQQAGRDRLRAGHRPRPARDRRVGARPGQARRQGRADRGHLRAACTSTRS